MRIQSGLPVGVNAAFFDEARRIRALEALLSTRLIEGGFHEVLLPILDYYQPYENLLTSGATESGAAEQLYRFIDRDGQLLALRHDFTPMLARLVAPRISQWQLPVRLFYRGDVVRFQEPRPGRLRESAQLGAEILDAPEASNEQEVLELFVDLLQRSTRSGTGGLQIVLGLANALEPLIAAAPDAAAAAQAVVRRDRTAAAAVSRALLEVVRDGAPSDFAALGHRAGELEGLFEIKERLLQSVSGDDVQVSVDLAEFEASSGTIQGSEHLYYQGLVFRAYRRGSAQPVGNGGRYDGLFKALGAEVSAAGFSIGLDQLLAAQDTGGI